MTKQRQTKLDALLKLYKIKCRRAEQALKRRNRLFLFQREIALHKLALSQDAQKQKPKQAPPPPPKPVQSHAPVSTYATYPTAPQTFTPCQATACPNQAIPNSRLCISRILLFFFTFGGFYVCFFV